MTAISRPVTRGVLPAVLRLSGQAGGDHALRRATLGMAIGKAAGLTLAQTAKRFGIPEKYAAYLLSDMLLVEGLLQATGGEVLRVSEIDLDNLFGLLADDRAFAWSGHYGCYLERLRGLGLAAYASDPESCAAEESQARP